MEELITVPTFTFDQGDTYEGAEQPIQVLYWNSDLVELRQGKNEILLNDESINKLFKLIKKHLPEARQKLKQ